MAVDEIMKGFKRTEVGVIPEDWEEALLERLATRGSGHTPNKNHPEYWGGEIKWISLADSPALDQGFICDTFAKVTSKGIANSSAVIHRPGTVVLSRDAGVGRSAIMLTEMAVSQHFIAWYCGPELDNTFFYYWLQKARPRFEQISNGTTIKTIGLAYFKRLTVPKPCIAEQQKIASTLRDVDALLRAQERLIAKKRNLKQAAMQELLRPMDHWHEYQLGREGALYGGLSGKTKADFDKGSARYVTFMNVISDVHIDTSALGRVDVKNGETQNEVQKGDLFFNGSSETPNEVALCSFLSSVVQQTFLNSFCFGFRLREQATVDPLCLAYYFRSMWGRKLVSMLAQGAIRYNISKSAFSKLSVRLPSLNDQREIASTLSDMDTEITAIEARLTKYRDIKQGMMQNLLTGAIRLV